MIGLLIERVSGQSFEAFIRARLADRLGMTVGFSLDDLEAASDAAPPLYDAGGYAVAGARGYPFRAVAAGAINTSIEGLANWMRLHLGKGEIDGERLLPAAMIDALQVPRACIRSRLPSRIRRSGLRPRLALPRSYRGDRVVFSWRRFARLVRTPMTLPAGLRHRGRRADQLQPDERRAAGAHLARRQPAARPRTDRLARARPQAARTSRTRKCRHTRTRTENGAAARIRRRHTTLGLMPATRAPGLRHNVNQHNRAEALHWWWRGLSAAMIHRHYETFELPEGLHPLLPYPLAITFLTDRDGDIVGLSTPLEPMVKDIVFARTK